MIQKFIYIRLLKGYLKIEKNHLNNPYSTFNFCSKKPFTVTSYLERLRLNGTKKHNVNWDLYNFLNKYKV